MNRIINNPDLVVEDMLVGILAAHPELAGQALEVIVRHPLIRK